MNKATKITLIVATVCLLLGGIMTFGALAAAQFDYRALSTASEVVEQSYKSERGDYQRIEVNGLSEDYSIIRGESNVVEVKYYTSDTLEYNFTSEGDTLAIDEKHINKIMFMNFNFDFTKRQAVIKVPADFTGEIDFYGASSNVAISSVEAQSLKAQVTSGMVYLEGLTLTETLSLDCTSGRVEMHSVSARSLIINGVSTDISGDRVNAADGFDLSTMSGGISLHDMQATDAIISTGSGDIDLNSITTQSLFADTGSGKVEGMTITSPVVSFRTTSGDIVARVVGDPSEYKITTHNVSGDITVPSGNDAAAGSITLETTSGDISLNFIPRS